MTRWWHRSEEHTSELQSHGLISYAVFCLKKKKNKKNILIVSYIFNPLISRSISLTLLFFFFFFNDTATTEIYTRPYTLSLHDALPISSRDRSEFGSLVRESGA